MSYLSRFMLLSFVAAVLGGCSGQDKPLGLSSSLVDISIVDNTFQPSVVTVSVGATVRWTNEDPACLCGDYHEVKSGTKEHPTSDFDLPFTEMGASGEFTFEHIGTFPYFCRNHDETGKIIVK